MLQATPQRFGPRVVAGATAHKAAKLCHPAHRLDQRGWLGWRRGTGLDGTSGACHSSISNSTLHGSAGMARASIVA